MKARLAVFISGNGSNLQALIDSQSQFDVRLVVASRTSAYGIRRAKRAGVPVLIVPSDKKKEALEDWVERRLEAFRIQAVALAGFMKVLSPRFVKRWEGKLVNIHPSLLPKHPGLRGFESALEAGDRYAGVTVHHVIEEVDSGEHLLQRRFLVPPGPLSSRWLALHITEQKLYAEGMRKYLCRQVIQHW